MAKTPTSDTNLGMTAVDAEKGEFYLSARPEDNRVVFMCVNGVPNTLLHQRNEGQVMSWTVNTNNINDVGSQFNIVPIEDKLLDYYREQMEKRKNVPLLFDAAAINARITDLNLLTFATEAEVNNSVSTADQKLVEIDRLADGQTVYFRHTGTKYLSAGYNSHTSSITLLPSSSTTPTKQEAFLLRYLGDGQYALVHTMTGMVVNRTANGGNATALLATAIAHGGKYRLVAGAQDNRVGLEAQNPESLSRLGCLSIIITR